MTCLTASVCGRAAKTAIDICNASTSGDGCTPALRAPTFRASPLPAAPPTRAGLRVCCFLGLGDAFGARGFPFCSAWLLPGEASEMLSSVAWPATCADSAETGLPAASTEASAPAVRGSRKDPEVFPFSVCPAPVNTLLSLAASGNPWEEPWWWRLGALPHLLHARLL